MKTEIKVEARQEAEKEQKEQAPEETKEIPSQTNKKKKGKGRANGEGWEEFKENKQKKDDGRIKSNAEKVNTQFERYYKQLGIVPPTEWYDFYAILKEPLDICFRINSIE